LPIPYFCRAQMALAKGKDTNGDESLN
jgi:hypothetical protein